LDPPRHDELRNLVSKVFTPRRMAEMEPEIRRIARSLLDGFSEEGRCDLMADYARHLPSLVIGSMIGIPEDRREAFLQWTEEMVAVDPGGTQNENVQQPAAEIYREFGKLLAIRRRERRDDLMSALVDAEIEGQKLSEEELLGFCFVLVVAGNDTTTNLIANGAVLLAHHPEQRAVLVRDPSLIPAAAEEMVRYESPAQALPRTATRDFERHGVGVPAGATVKLVWGAANRDEREFKDPDRFETRREIRRHLGYGHGIHFCLGANLARLEARVAFEELLARLPEYKLEAEPRWQTTVWARSYAGVPIQFEPAGRSSRN
jgi:cytochrome P450